MKLDEPERDQFHERWLARYEEDSDAKPQQQSGRLMPSNNRSLSRIYQLGEERYSRRIARNCESKD